MNLTTRRALILVAELLSFLLVTAVMTYFISHVAAPELAAGKEPPAEFPVIAYDGDRQKPDPKGYRVMPWSEWAAYAEKNPGASLVLPETSRALEIGAREQASFTASGSAAPQAVELTWRSGSDERRSRYVAEARGVQAQAFNTISTKTFLLAALAGFAAGMLVGRLLRRRWLPRVGDIVPLSPK